jgi:peptide/nickel transport system permease protein
MLSFAVGRVVSAIATLIIVAITVFVLIRMIPGDPAMVMLGDLADPESLRQLRIQLGLDKSVLDQFLIWASHVLRGDLGNSIRYQEPVLQLIGTRFLISAQIIVVALLLSSLVAVPAGMLAAWYQGRPTDLWIVGVATLLMSIPTFWMGLMLLIVFGSTLGWLPVVGYVPLSTNFRLGVLYLIMPILALFLHEMGVIVRMARASTLEVLRLDYIVHARAKGLSEQAVMFRHAFRNAFGPTWTVIGLTFGRLFGGIAVIETVFSIPGIGSLLVDSIFSRDYPVVEGSLIFITAIYVVVNLLVDLCYPFFDPRVAL